MKKSQEQEMSVDRKQMIEKNTGILQEWVFRTQEYKNMFIPLFQTSSEQGLAHSSIHMQKFF